MERDLFVYNGGVVQRSEVLYYSNAISKVKLGQYPPGTEFTWISIDLKDGNVACQVKNPKTYLVHWEDYTHDKSVEKVGFALKF